MKIIHITILNLLLVGYFAMVGLAVSGAVFLRGQSDQTLHPVRPAAPLTNEMVSGIIEGVDPSGMKVLLQTEMGLEAIPVANTSIMQRLTLGDQITVKLDEEGKVRRAMKTAFAGGNIR